MNKIYSVVWNSALGIWTVASELTRGKKKSNSRKTLAAMTAMTLLSMPHLASATITTTGTRNISADYSLIQPGTTDNVYNDRFLYSNDTLFGTLTISGALPTIEHGVAGVVDTTTIAELLDQDKIT
ncbi:autotransporter, partial [Escherichia coli]|nr:autotransporter [Escherichia coli]